MFRGLRMLNYCQIINSTSRAYGRSVRQQFCLIIYWHTAHNDINHFGCLTLLFGMLFNATFPLNENKCSVLPPKYVKFCTLSFSVALPLTSTLYTSYKRGIEKFKSALENFKLDLNNHVQENLVS